MVQTYGLTHINLAVRDLGRALRFYEQEHRRIDAAPMIPADD
jgi:catechol 2,3-dioxygenase-like lactoylglutathione lyase family enzyme